MANVKIGVLLDSLKLGVKKGMAKASALGLRGFQVGVARGELAPEHLSRTGQRDFLRQAHDHGLEISALLADYGKGFTDPNLAGELIEKMKRCIDLAVGLEVRVLSTHVGVIPEDESAPARETMSAVLTEIAAHAARCGRCIAAETGPEEPELMRAFFESLHCDGLKVNYDPANLVMRGFDPVAGVRTLHSYIVHTHAKDGRRLPTPGQPREVPLGEGDVPFREYLAAMAEIGYEGYYTIERETGADPAADIARAKRFLEGL